MYDLNQSKSSEICLNFGASALSLLFKLRFVRFKALLLNNHPYVEQAPPRAIRSMTELSLPQNTGRQTWQQRKDVYGTNIDD